MWCGGDVFVDPLISSALTEVLQWLLVQMVSLHRRRQLPQPSATASPHSTNGNNSLPSINHVNNKERNQIRETRKPWDWTHNGAHAIIEHIPITEVAAFPNGHEIAVKMLFSLLFTILYSAVVAKYSYSDKCYCYEGRDGSHCMVSCPHSHWVVINDQYYVNRRSVPIGRDRIIYAGMFDYHQPPTISVYYQYGFLFVFIWQQCV